jgi:Icc-related predicted phosphoesterase
MRVVALSDTHSYHRRIKIPEGDVLIHAGDITWRGELEIFTDFANWMKELPHKKKVIIFGNHELGMRVVAKKGIIKTHSGSTRDVVLKMIEDAGVTYLENSGTTIDGINFYGSPATPWFMDWEWNYQRGKDIGAVWDLIPDNTNVLITHGPPHGILDSVQDHFRGPQGCEMLRKKVEQLLNLKLHVFGHLHKDGSQTKKFGDTTFANVAICDDAYNTSRSPLVIDI